MRFRDLKIRTQLLIGFSIILFFVIVLSLTAFYQTIKLWEDTDNLYNHPLMTRRAIVQIEVDAILIHRDMKDIMLAENKEDVEKAIQSIDKNEADAYRQFDFLYERYLGDKSDIDIAYDNFTSWKSIRDETIRLYRNGDTELAIQRTMDAGAGGSHFNKLFASIDLLSTYAENKADEFYASVEDHKDDLRVQLIILSSLILIFSSLLIYALSRAIGKPIEALNDATDKFRQGNYKARSWYSSKNEYGSLSDSFNSLAENIENETILRGNIAEISDLMLREENLKNFCTEFLKELIKKTNSQSAAVYFLDEDKKEFVLYESIGLNGKAKKSFSLIDNEGEIGIAAASKKIQHIKDIPEDSFINFTAAVSDFLPKEIITIPVVYEKEVIAVVSLSSIKKYSDLAVKLLNEIWIVSSARIGGLMASWRISELAKKLELQNLELEQQSKELSMQKEELSEQNSELEIQKNQLDAANKLKSSFLSNMSHELRTPLNSIIALSGVLSRRLLKSISPEDHSYLSVIERSGKNLLSLINDLLDISRIEAGKEELIISGFKIEELINNVFEIIKPQADEKNISLVKIVGKNIPVIISDFKKCQSILQNLVANAVKFTEKGSVEINVNLVKKMIFIRVKDTGIGIENEKLSLIFDEFRQGDDSASKKYEGTGLGLAIAKKYAAMLHGDIEVKSILGQGSEFTFKMPLKLSENMAIDSDYIENEWKEIDSYYSSIDNFDYKNKTILIVEDSEPAIIQLREILENKGIKIMTARNGREAIESINQNIADAMILDLMMPEVDGFEVLKSIREKDNLSSIPILILTAKHITKEELSFLKGNNIYQLIQKGDISKKELLKAIKNMLFHNSKKAT